MRLRFELPPRGLYLNTDHPVTDDVCRVHEQIRSHTYRSAKPEHRRAGSSARCYGEVGGYGERSTSRVISLGAKTRNGGPQKPVPRLV